MEYLKEIRDGRQWDRKKITYCYCLTAMEVIVESRSERVWALYGNGMHFVAHINGRYNDTF